MSVKDYDSRLLNVWNDAALKPIALPITDEAGQPDLSKAIVQRHQMYRLRADMEREKHVFSENAEKAKISVRITLKSGKVIFFSHKKNFEDRDVVSVELLIQPKNDESMDKALAAAGYDVPEAPKFD